MAQKILIVGAGANDVLLLAKLKEEHGGDIILVTPEEAKEQGLKMEDFGNIPTFKITASPIIPMMELGEYKTGKEQRRERRKKKRMLNKRR
jgi:ketopantoate reductase